MPAIADLPFANFEQETHLLLADDQHEKAKALVADVVRLMEAAADSSPPVTAADDFWRTGSSWLDSMRPYDVVDRVVQIPIKGVLLDGFPYQMGRRATGYEYIVQAFQRAADDYAAGAIKGVAMVIDSPGGMVSGMFEAADTIATLIAARKMPVTAFATDACSAAYALACLADEIVVGRLSQVGSIGVLTQHISYARALDKEGIDVTLITSPKGGHKGEGSPTQPLSKSAQERLQKTSDTIYGIFTGLVSDNRGMSDEAVRATQAKVYLAGDAIEVGLADRTAVLSDALISYRKSLNGEKAMSQSNEGGKTVAASFTQEQFDAAVAQATETGKKAGAEAERTRVKAIVESDDAKGKLASAVALALSSGDLTAATAAVVLKTVPEAAKTPSKTGFETAMETTLNPNAGPGDDKAPKDDPNKTAMGLLGSLAAVTGFDYRPKAG